MLALTTTDARLEVVTPQDETEAAELAAELDAWLDGARIPAGPVRTCFRLAEPADPGLADPLAGGVRAAVRRGPEPDDLRRRRLGRAGAGPSAAPGLAGGDPVEELLAGLGAAARLFGELDDALREAAPAEVELDTPGAFRFLKETGPLLSGAGFGVLLPDWVRKARLGLKLTTRSQSPVGASVTGPKFGLGDLVNFRYDLAVGDEALDPDELAELARLKVPLVRLRGQWVELDEAHLKAALRFLEREPGRDDDRGRRAGGRAARPGLRRPAGRRWTPTAGSATCCPARPTGGCGP